MTPSDVTPQPSHVTGKEETHHFRDIWVGLMGRQHGGFLSAEWRRTYWDHRTEAQVTHSSISVSLQTWLLFHNQFKKPNTHRRYQTQPHGTHHLAWLRDNTEEHSGEKEEGLVDRKCYCVPAMLELHSDGSSQ